MVDNLIEFFKGADDCQDVEPIESQQFTYVFGKNLCVKRQGESFPESTRPKGDKGDMKNVCP